MNETTERNQVNTSAPGIRELSEAEVESVSGGGWWARLIAAISSPEPEQEGTFVAGVRG